MNLFWYTSHSTLNLSKQICSFSVWRLQIAWANGELARKPSNENVNNSFTSWIQRIRLRWFALNFNAWNGVALHRPWNSDKILSKWAISWFDGTCKQTIRRNYFRIPIPHFMKIPHSPTLVVAAFPVYFTLFLWFTTFACRSLRRW